jgi:hypothetical protein
MTRKKKPVLPKAGTAFAFPLGERWFVDASYCMSVLLTNAIFLLSGDHDGTLIVP